MSEVEAQMASEEESKMEATNGDGTIDSGTNGSTGATNADAEERWVHFVHVRVWTTRA